MAERITLSFGDYSRAVDVPNGVTATIHDAFAEAYKRPTEIEDPDNEGEMIDNPESKEAFTTKRIRLYVEDILAAYNKKNARATAEASADEANAAVLGAIVIDPV